MKITRRQLRQIIKEELSIVSEGYGLKMRVELIKPKGLQGLSDLHAAYGEIKDLPGPVEFTVKNGNVKGDSGTTRDKVQRITDLVLSDAGATWFRGRKKTGDAQRELVKKGTFTVAWSK
jgi:hypothetical protein